VSPPPPPCGQLLRFCEQPGGPAVLEPPECARRAGHKSPRHRSAAAMEAARRRAAGQAPTGSADIAAAIGRMRREAGLSKRALAAAVGVSDTCVNWWERGRRAPSAEHWVQLELTLGPLGIVRGPGPEAGQEQRRGAPSCAA